MYLYSKRREWLQNECSNGAEKFSIDWPFYCVVLIKANNKTRRDILQLLRYSSYHQIIKNKKMEFQNT